MEPAQDCVQWLALVLAELNLRLHYQRISWHFLSYGCNGYRYSDSVPRDFCESRVYHVKVRRLALR
jgi:hypothetical protein